MAIQIQGSGGTVADVDGTTFRANRVTIRPTDHGSFGHYRYGGSTGILPAALGANSEVFQFRWVDTTRFAVITRVRIAASVTTTMFAAGVPVEIDIVKATAWTGQGTLGTGVTPAALLKQRTSIAATLAGTGTVDVAGTLASTLAAVTLAGTGTVDVQGTLSSTLAAATLAGTGTVESAGVSGALAVTLASATCVAFSHDQQRTYKTFTGQLVNWDVAALAWNHERVRRLARWAEIQRRTAVLRWSNTSSLVLVVDLHGAQSQYVRQDIMDALMPYYTGWTQT